MSKGGRDIVEEARQAPDHDERGHAEQAELQLIDEACLGSMIGREIVRGEIAEVHEEQAKVAAQISRSGCRQRRVLMGPGRLSPGGVSTSRSNGETR